MTPIQRELKKRDCKEKKAEVAAKIGWGDLTALANEGQYHYNTYRRFINVDDELWSDGVYIEVLAYLDKKEKALA